MSAVIIAPFVQSILRHYPLSAKKIGLDKAGFIRAGMSGEAVLAKIKAELDKALGRVTHEDENPELLFLELEDRLVTGGFFRRIIRWISKVNTWQTLSRKTKS